MFRVDQFLSTGNYQSGRLMYLLDEQTDDYVDIDTPGDFARASILVQKHCEKHNLGELLPKTDSKTEKEQTKNCAEIA